MSTGVVVLALAVSLALGVGLWRAATDGRFRKRHGATSATAASTTTASAAAATSPAAELVDQLGASLGERATLLQFSSAFCAPCRATRTVLTDVSGLVEGVTHVEVDAEEHLAATRALGILRTPTTLVLDASGMEVTRAGGAPTRDQVLAAIARVGTQA
ncbi:thioredoxin [Nocardioides seonyuensis]|uniref:Thioredoxin n=1 Tax=Nocardioides seonyuensis TaxID=2518371 RepID=A0A4P7IF26_9ACTN|nr:thioredoxin family protein [Nocardioides seonyuensis]QBX55836.1 thioredoxin [Nocardioides seonyuensis]